MPELTITDFNNAEFNYVSEMIHEKLIDMGYKTDGTFSFDLIVSFEETEEEED